MRLIIIAHGLCSRAGHHYMEARAFKEEAAKLGLGCLVLANRQVIPSIREELGALPLFQYTPYHRHPHDSSKTFRVLSQSMGRQLMSLSPDMITASDVVIATLAGASEMSGLAMWLAKRPRGDRPFVAINFMIDDIPKTMVGNRQWQLDKPITLLYRHAFSQLQELLDPERLLVSSGGIKFSQVMSRVINHPVQTFPLPVQLDFPPVEAEPDLPGRPPLIVFIGYTNLRKGSDLIGSVVRRVLEKNADCRFLLQSNPVSWEKRWRDEIGAKGGERVRIHVGEMTQEEYQEAIGRADLVLLPYRPEIYRLQTSGVFSEAMALGKISIIPSDTWMDGMARQYGGGAVTFQQHEAEDVATAILLALKNLPQLTLAMQDIGPKWCESVGMKAFIRKVVEAFSRRVRNVDKMLSKS